MASQPCLLLLHCNGRACSFDHGELVGFARQTDALIPQAKSPHNFAGPSLEDFDCMTDVLAVGSNVHGYLGLGKETKCCRVQSCYRSCPPHASHAHLSRQLMMHALKDCVTCPRILIAQLVCLNKSLTDVNATAAQALTTNLRIR